MDFSEFSLVEILTDHAAKLLMMLVVLFVALSLHELGHLLAARALRLKVDKVQIGLGRLIRCRPSRSGTLWCMHAVPLGAHVLINAEDFQARPFWQRALTILAGPAVNLALPFVLFTAFYLAVGQPSGPPVVVGIERGQVADKAGFQPGDRILSVDGVPVVNYREIYKVAYEGGLGEKRFRLLRGGAEMEIVASPIWAKYRDEKGIDRANARYGIVWSHAPFKLSSVTQVNGDNVRGDREKARALLLANMDRDITIQIKGAENELYNYRVRPHADANLYLADKNHKDGRHVYLGPTRDNFYLRQDAAAQVRDAFAFSLYRIKALATLPLQIFPIDPYAVRDEFAVLDFLLFWPNIAYSFVHKLAVISIALGLINLLPLPLLDGGHILVQAAERITGRPVSRKTQGRMFMAGFALVYFSILFANMDKLPRYIDSRLRNLVESVNKSDSSTIGTKKKG